MTFIFLSLKYFVIFKFFFYFLKCFKYLENFGGPSVSLYEMDRKSNNNLNKVLPSSVPNFPQSLKSGNLNRTTSTNNNNKPSATTNYIRSNSTHKLSKACSTNNVLALNTTNNSPPPPLEKSASSQGIPRKEKGPCQTFQPQRWRKDTCANCFQKKLDHAQVK